MFSSGSLYHVSYRYTEYCCQATFQGTAGHFSHLLPFSDLEVPINISML